MKINKMTISYSVTVQMRQFEPITLFASAEVQLDPGDTMEQAFQRTKAKLRKELDDEAHKLKVERKESYSEDSGLEKSS